MNRIEDYGVLKTKIVKWIKDYAQDNQIQSLVVGVSGGIDSAVVSTLCAETKLPTFLLGMPIHQDLGEESLSDEHLAWLDEKYEGVRPLKFDLTKTFEEFKKTLKEYSHDDLALANTRSRFRMATLYQIAGKHNGIVVGTGNKVEDYGVGFFTKYGDGGVDIAPIADLYKTEARELGKLLGVSKKIIEATPTDGLWDDKRTDEDQLGVSYTLLEQAMETGTGDGVPVLRRFNQANQHKMQPIPTFKL